jgi:hypothetical protein
MSKPGVFGMTENPHDGRPGGMDLEQPDIAPIVKADLLHLQSLYEKADETYRRFRTIIMAPPGAMTDGVPSEWIPISDQ